MSTCECYLVAFSCLRHLFLYLRWSFFPIHSVYDSRIKSSTINICLLSNRFYESPRWITEHIVLHIVTHHFQGIKCRKNQPNKLLSTHLKVIKSNELWWWRLESNKFTHKYYDSINSGNFMSRATHSKTIWSKSNCVQRRWRWEQIPFYRCALNI